MYQDRMSWVDISLLVPWFANCQHWQEQPAMLLQPGCPVSIDWGNVRRAWWRQLRNHWELPVCYAGHCPSALCVLGQKQHQGCLIPLTWTFFFNCCPLKTAIWCKNTKFLNNLSVFSAQCVLISAPTLKLGVGDQHRTKEKGKVIKMAGGMAVVRNWC